MSSRKLKYGLYGVMLFSVMAGATESEQRTWLPELKPMGKLVLKSGEFIETVGGHAAPFAVDINGDGRKDLVVGEFGRMTEDLFSLSMKYMKSEATQADLDRMKYLAGHVSNAQTGRARVYLNVGSDQAPEFSEFSYLQSGSDDVRVQSICCIGIDPFFADFNGDGVLDYTSGQYTGGLINFYRGYKDGRFAEGVKIPELDMKPIQSDWLMRTANFADFDGDGDLDMFTGDVDGGVHLTVNKGNRKHYRYASRIDLTSQGEPMVVDSKSDPLPVDWDGDGILDLLVGTEASDVVFFKGKRAEGTDFEAGVSIWSGMKLVPGEEVDHMDVVERLEDMGEQRPYPGYRVRIQTTDWNNDGKLDLLVGNTIVPNPVDDVGHGETFGHVYLFLRK